MCASAEMTHYRNRQVVPKSTAIRRGRHTENSEMEVPIWNCQAAGSEMEDSRNGTDTQISSSRSSGILSAATASNRKNARWSPPPQDVATDSGEVDQHGQNTDWEMPVPVPEWLERQPAIEIYFCKRGEERALLPQLSISTSTQNLETQHRPPFQIRPDGAI